MANSYKATLDGLLPDHTWELDEAAGTYADSGNTGGLTLAESSAGALWRVAPGIVRGTPRIHGLWGNQSGNSNLVQNAAGGVTGLGWTTGTVCAVVHVYSLNSEIIYPFTQNWSNNAGLALLLRINTNGSAEFRVEGSAGQFNSGVSAAASIVEGQAYFILGVQRADGNGMRVYINGVDATDSTSQGGGSAINDFVDGVGLGALDPPTDFGIGGNNAIALGGAIISGVGVWRNTALTAGQITSLFQSINGFDQSPTDWYEKIFDLADGVKLNYWCPHWRLDGNRMAAIADGVAEASQPDYTGTLTDNVVDGDIVSDFNSFRTDFSGANGAIFSDSTVNVDGTDTTGTINVVARITSAPIGIQKNMLSLGDFTADRFELSIVGTALGYEMQFRMEINTGAFVQAVGFSNFLSLPQYMMFTVVQDGTGYQLYINGASESFLETGGGGAVTDTSWIGQIIVSAAGPDSVRWSGVAGSGSAENFTPNGIADAFITRAVLTAAEVSALYDALLGIFPPEVPFGAFATELSNTGNGANPEGPGPDWWWRMNVATGVVQDIGIARARSVSPINGDAIVEGGDPLHSVTGPLPDDAGNAAIYFDGTGDYFEIGVNGVGGELVDVSTGSIGCFFSRNALQDENIIYAQANDARTAFWQWGLNNQAVELIVQTSAGNRVTLTSSVLFADNDFHLIVLTCDGSVYRLYIDGTEDTSATVVALGTGAEGDWFDALTADNSAIASQAGVGFLTETTGRISELFIYDGDVLSETEIGLLAEAAIDDGITGSPATAGLVVFENVTFRNGAFADIRAQNAQPSTFQQVVRGNRCKFLNGQQGDAFTQPQCVLLEGPAHATFRGCEADLQATPTFGRGGIVGTAINTALSASQDGSIIVSDCDFDQMGFLDGSTFLAPVMCQAAFGMTVEDSRFRDCLGTAVGWLADAQRVSVTRNQIERTTQALGAIYSAQGLNARLGSGWLVRVNKVIDTVGPAINLNGVTSAGGTNFARNINIQNNETDNNLTGQSIRVNQVADVLIEDNKGNRCTFGVDLGEIQSSIVVRRNQMDEASLAAFITNATASLQLADLTVDRNKADGNAVGDGILVTQVRRAVIINNKLMNMDDAAVLGEIGIEGVFAHNQIEGVTPFDVLPATTQNGLVVGRNQMTDLGNAAAIVVSSRTIEVIAHYHTITATGAIDLELINGPLVDGYLLVLRRGLFSSNITIKEGMGNLNIGSDFLMDVDNDQIWLVCRSVVWKHNNRVEAL